MIVISLRGNLPDFRTYESEVYAFLVCLKEYLWKSKVLQCIPFRLVVHLVLVRVITRLTACTAELVLAQLGS
jgi:hypothetical protein